MNNKSFIILIILYVALIPFSMSYANEINVIINEIAWAGTTEGWRYEWVELFNGSGGAVDISGWQIENAQAKNEPLVLTSGTIPPHGYFLICKKEMFGCDIVETRLSLHNEYDQNGKLVLKNSAGTVVNSTPEPENKTWPGGDNKTKQTMERVQNEWQTSATPDGTPKAQNSIVVEPSPSPEPTENQSGRSEAPSALSTDEVVVVELEPEIVPEAIIPAKIEYPGGIFINEIMPSPEGADAENEWIELYNSNSFEVDLGSWQIKDKVGAIKTYTCPTNTKIMSYGFLIVPRTKSNITLQNSGDELELLNPNQELVYSVDYPKATQGQSYSRINETWSWSNTPTPGKTNIIPKLIQPKNTQPNKVEAGPLLVEPPVIANIGGSVKNDTSKTSNRILTFIFAIIIAIGSGVVVLFLKQKSTK